MTGLPSDAPVRRLPRNRTKSTDVAGHSSNTAEELDRAVQKLQQEVPAFWPHRAANTTYLVYHILVCLERLHAAQRVHSLLCTEKERHLCPQAILSSCRSDIWRSRYNHMSSSF